MMLTPLITKRNIERFPEDFMFQLSPEEFANLKSQIGISSWGGVRTAPYAFTEQGVSMLSSVLRSARAIQVNIEIMRVPPGTEAEYLSSLFVSTSYNNLISVPLVYWANRFMFGCKALCILFGK